MSDEQSQLPYVIAEGRRHPEVGLLELPGTGGVAGLDVGHGPQVRHRQQVFESVRRPAERVGPDGAWCSAAHPEGTGPPRLGLEGEARRVTYRCCRRVIAAGPWACDTSRARSKSTGQWPTNEIYAFTKCRVSRIGG
jgi:hypothetical protein